MPTKTSAKTADRGLPLSIHITENERRFIEKAEKHKCFCDEAGDFAARKMTTEERRGAARLVAKGVLVLVRPTDWEHNRFPANRSYQLNPDCRTQDRDEQDASDCVIYKASSGGTVTVKDNITIHRMAG